MAIDNRITKVAIVGAGGNVGSFMSNALLRTGKHIVTAITRIDSQSTLPQGVVAKKVNYDTPETLVDALQGQDALVITLSGRSQLQETEEKLIKAAAEAGVPWILPNEWSPDSAHEGIVKDVWLFEKKVAARKLVQALGKSSYISVVTGFWYEYSLAMPPNYGFDFANRTVIFFDEGETKISTSTWPQIGRAVAALLSLPIRPEGSTQEACLENFRNEIVYINSFTVSQKDILESTLRVTGTTQNDWTIVKEDARERFDTGLREMKEGKWASAAKVLYTRIFFPDGSGDFEHNKGTLNDLLGLPTEDIDEATKLAIERAKATN